jgi:hypothetical protein|tara:strand:+ start:228 stop:431 length:204 start_codon:yes stop_codon:yes gene_type:complete
MKAKSKKDSRNNPVMVCSEVAWNEKATNKVEIGKTQYIVRYVGDDGRRSDESFASKEEALKFFDSIK